MNTKRKELSILLSTSLLCMATVYVQNQLPPLANRLMEEFGMNATQYSSTYSSQMIPAIVLSLIMGILVDKIGIRPVVLISGVVSTIGVILRVFSTTYLPLYIFMIMTGVCSTAINSNVGKIYSVYCPPEKLSSILIARTDILTN